MSQIVPTLLPVAVNVQDFFRATRYSTDVSLARSTAHLAPRLFTRFSVSTTSNQHVRIRSAKLVPESDSPGQLRISPCTPRSSDILVRWFITTPTWPLSTSFKTVTPAHPASFLFKIESDVGRGAECINLRPPIPFTPVVVGEILKLRIVYREFRKGRCLVVGIGVWS